MRNLSLSLQFVAGAAAVFGLMYCSPRPIITDPDDGGDHPVCDDAGGPGCSCVDTTFKPADCYTGPKGTNNKGPCKAGKRTCKDGVVTKCEGEVTPTEEVCDYLDNDCDGVTDNVKEIKEAEPIANCTSPACDPDHAEAGIYCYTAEKGICGAGVKVCAANRTIGCKRYIFVGADEVCNNIDDDCDGEVDQGLDDMGTCDITGKKGECAVGANACAAGVETCTQKNFPTAEKCNNKDDDCDGQKDEGATCPYTWQTCISGSCWCPFVFSGDGQKFAYETTIGGASVVGKKSHLLEGKKIDFASISVRLDHQKVDYSSGAGVITSKLIDADDEIVYFDEAHLAVFEVQAGFEVVSSSAIEWQTLKQKKDPNEFYSLRTSSLRAPAHATWTGGQKTADVTSAIATVDDRAVAYDERSANIYELDFGAIKDSSHARIVIDGWKYKGPRHLPDSVAKEHPRLEIQTKDGTWVKAMNLATPRGDRKAVTFDLSNVKFANGQYKMRIFTGTHEDGAAMWYIDRIRLTEEAAIVTLPRNVPMTQATLAFTGVPSQIDVEHNDHPRLAFDDGKGELLPEHRTWGKFTRYGDVRELLGSADDRMIVMRRGDGVTMAFTGVPKPAAGNVITAFLETELLFKPRVFANTSTDVTQNVEPMPFHGMVAYPPASKYPDDQAHQKYRADYQTREYVKGDSRWGK